MSTTSSALPSFSTISTSTAFAVTVNYIIGTGAFGLPYGVMQAGTLLSFVCIAVFTLVSSICLCYVIESMARAGGIMEAEKLHNGGVVKRKEHSETDPLVTAHSAPGHYTPHIGYDKVNPPTVHCCRPLLWSGPYTVSDAAPLCHLLLLVLRCVQIDFSMMSQLFGGPYAHAFVHIVMTLYSYGVLWAYAAVFSSSVASIVFQYALNEECNIYMPHSFSCSVGYVLSVLVFAVIVTWLSLQDMGDQATVQQLLTAYRFSAFFTMIVTCCLAFMQPNQFDPAASTEPPTFAPLPFVQWSGFGLIFCTTAVALDVHWNIPDVLLPMRDKRYALRMALGALLTAALFYSVIALVCALEFGQQTLPLVTLNWSNYTGRLGGWFPSPNPHPLATLTKLFIILFPVLNQCSVYPLVVLTLGDNYYALLPAEYHQRWGGYVLKRWCRLLACLPPILFALFFGKLDTIFTITGLFAFCLEFITPCLLQLASRRLVRERYGGEDVERTMYSSWVSQEPVVWCVLMFGCVAFGVSIVSTAMGAGEVS